MEPFLKELQSYLQHVLGIFVEPKRWEGADRLPFFLRDTYNFYEINILDVPCLLMVARGVSENTPSTIQKHLNQLQEKWGNEVIYVKEAMHPLYFRKRLIDYKIPFIVPGNQMYLPLLGIDLREYLKRLRKKKLVFSPSTQALILHVLWHKETGTMVPNEIANLLGYSAMTMTRAFDELEEAGIGEHSAAGKERQLRFAEVGKTLWEKVLPYLNTPVKKRLYIATSKSITLENLAGESALSNYTMLAEPKVPVYALTIGGWMNVLQRDNIIKLSLPDPEGLEIELWKYNPALFANNGKVDRLSLYLSLKDNTDERIQSALDELLKGMEW